MSQVRNEDHVSAAAPQANRPEGVRKNSNRMTLLTQGYPGPMGYVDKPKIQIVRRQTVGDKKLNWVRISMPKLYLSSTAHLLFLQGVAPVQFFLASSLTGKRPQPGPLLFLRGTLSRPWEVPAYWENLVVGRLFQDIPKLNVLEVFKALSFYESKQLG